MKFTIGLPVTKTNYLKETLDSISKQTFSDYELVIRNNAASPELKDEVKTICSDWLEKENVVYTESKEQLKIADNFNEIVKVAKGEYITILSDDDIIQPQFLEEFNQMAEKYPNVDVLHCRVKIINQDGELIQYTELCPEFETLPDFLYHRLIGVRNIYLSDFVVNTKALQKIGGFPVKSQGWGVDTLTWHLMGNNGFAYASKPLLNYRVNTANFSNNRNNLFIKLEDIKYLKSEKERIVKSEEFKQNSIYPESFLLEKIEERFNSDAAELMAGISRAYNLFGFLKLYRKYKEPYNLTKKLLYKLILKKLFIG